MSKSILSFIQSALLLILFCILPFKNTEAQIIYTDLTPDSIINTSGGFYDLDLNNDSINDFKLTYTTTTITSTFCTGTKINRYLRISPADSTLDEVANVLYTPLYYPEPIKTDTLINDSNYVWKNVSGQTLLASIFICGVLKGGHIWRSSISGKWSNGTIKFLGLRFKVGNNIYYGWVRLMTTSSSITIMDYAYNSNPGQFIYAGQLIDDHIDLLPVQGSPFCNGSNLTIAYTTMGVFDTANVFTAQLSDSSGLFTNPVNIGNITSDTSGLINCTIPPGTIQSYLYRIRIISSNPVLTGSSNATNLIVNTSLPDSQITYSGSTLICHGNSLILEAPTALENSFQWTLNNNNISGANSYQYMAYDTGIYICSITNGCGTILSDSIVISMHPFLPVSITPASTLWLCPGLSVLLTASPAPGYTYKWFKNNFAVVGISQTYNVTQTGIYNVQTTDSFGCVNNSNFDTITISDPYSVTTAIGPTTVCDGDSVLLYQSALSDTGFTYQWYFGSNTIPNATLPTYTALVTGLYRLAVTNPNGNCTTTSSGIYISVGCVGINEAPSYSHFSINPNPSTHLIYVSNILKHKATIEIINSFGQIIYTKFIYEGSDIIDVSRFAAGIYFLKWLELNYSEMKEISVSR